MGDLDTLELPNPYSLTNRSVKYDCLLEKAVIGVTGCLILSRIVALSHWGKLK